MTDDQWLPESHAEQGGPRLAPAEIEARVRSYLAGAREPRTLDAISDAVGQGVSVHDLEVVDAVLLLRELGVVRWSTDQLDPETLIWLSNFPGPSDLR